MLKTLTIKNFAIIENTSLSFHLGFNVLVGETGAGKSIILDALNFVLGDKPSKDNIRHGATELVVKAIFENIGEKVIEKLNEFEIECEDMLIVSRSFNIEGKSSCLLNGEPVTVSMLKQIGALILDFYGQNESVSILNVKNHIKLLDSYKPNLLEKTKENIANLLQSYKDINKEIEIIGGRGEDRERTLDLLSYQIKEIENTKLEKNEDVVLEEKIKALSNYEKISTSLNQCYNSLKNNELNNALSNLNIAKEYDGKLLQYNERLNGCIIEIEDICASIKEYLSNMSFSETELDSISERKDQIKSLKKKYGSSLEDIEIYLNKIKKEYDDIINSEAILKKLITNQNEIKHKLYNECLKLHNLRLELSEEVEQKVKNELFSLGMENTQFKISFKNLKQENECDFTNNGIDEVEFLFSANVGEEQKSLAKTISGGEMSRFMLAIKNVFANANDVSVLVFDEVDAGVSGEIGYKVGQKLAMLSKRYQIICITHLAQVTALADKHIYISKTVENNQTKSVAKYLNENELLKYLATLFGSKSSEIALMHSKELLNMSNDYKQSLNN